MSAKDPFPFMCIEAFSSTVGYVFQSNVLVVASGHVDVPKLDEWVRNSVLPRLSLPTYEVYFCKNISSICYTMSQVIAGDMPKPGLRLVK